MKPDFCFEPIFTLIQAFILPFPKFLSEYHLCILEISHISL